ncbi:winged helix-turn-helix domain-containing protein [Enterobacter quasiroggenkampii]|uniref:winged helix-turn-helix domain-containing protein n=1 Tax=Enterobacter quasiroggenkampii TaxID=2497436 RepID=UPI0021CFA7A2|nr:winged helix-turn-helix domain-containing protein [Enterobacter quasiroggenkampii]MCU6359059.1 winged helix-turn-helix domain-containing protein [Enterobacter quasiroggenkampii]
MLENEERHQAVPDFYKIEEIIHFYPDEYMLRNVINGETVTLLSTAAECFRILINEQGRIVSRKEIKEQVWGKRGVVVSSNTFYQNMLNIRRGLEKVGAGSHIISTHYGKGVSIDAGVKVTLIVSDTSPSVKEVYESPEANGEMVMKDFHTSVDTSKSKSENFLSLAVVNTILFLICIVMLFVREDLKRANYFSEYTRTAFKVKNCSIYTDPTQMDENELQQFLKHNTPDCEEGETLYLSSVYPVQRMSVIRCTGSFLPGDECESDYYLE